APERAQPERRRIGRIEQTDPFDGILQIAGDDVGLDDRQQVGPVYRGDSVQPLERDHDAAVGRDGAPGVAGAGAARHDRNAPGVAEPRDRGDLVGVARKHYGVRRLPALHRVRSIWDPDFVVCLEMVRADDRAEGVEKRASTFARSGRQYHACAAAPRVSSARMNSRIFAVPRSRSVIDVAYDSRKNPGASNASPGVIATRASSSSTCASSAGVRMVAGEGNSLTSGNG